MAEYIAGATAFTLTGDLPVHKVGMADSREGYESTNYQTRSEAIVESRGVRQHLRQMTLDLPIGLPPISIQVSSEEIDLGRKLFFDRRLSKNSTLSCAMCHIPEQGFTQNELSTPVGHMGKGVRRNVPSLYNVAFVERLFLDGREKSLATQVWSPLLAPNEMANPNRGHVIAKLRADDQYVAQFEDLYKEGLSEDTLGRALAAYQKAILSGDSHFDRWYFGGRESVLSGDNYPDDAIRGFEIFREKGCDSCHAIGKDNALFTDSRFYNTGVGYLRYRRSSQPMEVQLAPGIFVKPAVFVETETFLDDGRAEVTGKTGDRWRYRTPTLRNVELTSPYMHDGSIATLEDVMKFYSQGGGGDPKQDPRIGSFVLSQGEQASLIAFLRTLTSSNVDALVSDARSIAIGDEISSTGF